jgi:predicted nucleotide-binding protein
LGKYFHVLIELEKRPSVVKFDLSDDQLFERVVIPYRQGRFITLQGVNVDPASMRRIQITTSDVPSERLRQIVTARYQQSSYITIRPPIAEWTVEEGEDVTDQYITSSPGQEKVPSVESVPTAKGNADRRKVFVIHGRDDKAKRGVFSLLRAADLLPVEWSEAKAATGKASPYIGEIIEQGFSLAQAAVVLITPDDKAMLKSQFHSPHEPEYEMQLTGQARPNVLFEAGMAMSKYPDRTVIVEMGKLRPFSDIVGRHTVRLDNSISKRQDLLDGLKTAGCTVSYEHRRDWQTAGTLELTTGE